MGKRSEGKPPSQSNFAHQIFRHHRGVAHKQTARPLKASETERSSSECTTLISRKAKSPRHRVDDDAYSKKETRRATVCKWFDLLCLRSIRRPLIYPSSCLATKETNKSSLPTVSATHSTTFTCHSSHLPAAHAPLTYHGPVTSPPQQAPKEARPQLHTVSLHWLQLAWSPHTREPTTFFAPTSSAQHQHHQAPPPTSTHAPAAAVAAPRQQLVLPILPAPGRRSACCCAYNLCAEACTEYYPTAVPRSRVPRSRHAYLKP